MRRVTPIPPLDTGCATARANYSSTANYERFLKGQIQSYVDTINGFTGAQIEQLKNSREAANTNTYNLALDNLQLAENTLSSTIRCIQSDILQRNEYSSRIYTLQQDIERLRKELQEKQEIVKTSKERSELLKDPYTKTTRWELWFPLGRPIRKENVPVLLSVSILMLVFALGIFLRVAGFELRMEALETTSNSLFKPIPSGKYP